MDAGKVLTPGVAEKRVVGQPRLTELVSEGIATTVDAVEVVIAVSAFDEVTVAVSGGGDGRGITSTYSTVVLAVHIVCGGGFFPDGSETFVIDGADFVDATVGTVGLDTTGVVVGIENPLEMTADTIGCFSQQRLLFEECCERLLAVFGITMQVDGAPGAVFAVQELVRATEFVGIVVGRTTVCAAPVLYDIPVSAFAAVAGGDGPLVKAGGVKAADDVAALLGKLAGQDALVLQAPEDDAGRVAAFLYPTHEQVFKVAAELRCVVPDMSGKLAPEENALFVAQLLIEQVVRLMRLAQGIEARICYLFDAGANLFRREGMALAEDMFILTSAIDEDGGAVEVKAVVIDH